MCLDQHDPNEYMANEDDEFRIDVRAATMELLENMAEVIS